MFEFIGMIVVAVIVWQVVKNLFRAWVVNSTHKGQKVFNDEVLPKIYHSLAKGDSYVKIPRKYVDAVVTVHNFQGTGLVDRLSIKKQGSNYLFMIKDTHKDKDYLVIIDGVDCSFVMTSLD